MVRLVWSMVKLVWSMVRLAWSMVKLVWSMVRLVWSMVRGTRVSRARLQVLNASWALFGTFPLYSTHVSFFYITLFLSFLCLLPPLASIHPCCSHARGILCIRHTSCMGFSFPAVYANWSLVFRSFATTLY